MIPCWERMRSGRRTRKLRRVPEITGLGGTVAYIKKYLEEAPESGAPSVCPAFNYRPDESQSNAAPDR